MKISKNTIFVRNWRLKQKKKGLCQTCKKGKALKRKTLCKKCRDKQSDDDKTNRVRRREYSRKYHRYKRRYLGAKSYQLKESK